MNYQINDKFWDSVGRSVSISVNNWVWKSVRNSVCVSIDNQLKDDLK